MDRLPPLNALRAFEAAGRLRSIRRASDELHVTAAAVSRQVRVLEDFLGVQLFIRSHRAVNLTAAGERYLHEITKSLAGIRTATRHAIAGRGRRALKIRTYTTFALRWLIPRLSSFHQAHPQIDVQLTTSLDRDLEDEDLDAAIRLGDGNWPGLQAERLVPHELVPVCSPLLLRRRPRLRTAADLKHHTLLHSLARPHDWAQWLDAAGIANVDPHAGPRYESSTLAYQAAIEGQGVAMGQKVLVMEDLASGKLVMPCSFVLDMGRNTYYFLFRAAGRNKPLDIFRAWLKTQLE